MSGNAATQKGAMTVDEKMRLVEKHHLMHENNAWYSDRENSHKRFIEVCNRISEDRDGFLTSCQQIMEMFFNTTALGRKIEAQYARINELTTSMQGFIKENAMEAQDEDFYKVKMAEYNAKKADMAKVLHDLMNKRAERLSCKELLEGLIRTMRREDIVTNAFDGKLWLLLVEKVTVDTDGGLTFTLRNGMEIEV